MFCSKCGSKIEDGSKFCHQCGTNVETDLLFSEEKKKIKQVDETNIKSENTRETVAEYQARTNIKSKEEARKYLNQLKALFWIVFLSMIIIRGLGESESELATILFIPYIGLLIYFVVFSTKILKAEKLSGLNALWCILFAPISWFYLYPLMADPLKIILGEKQPPIRLSDKERKEKTAKVAENNKKFWKNFCRITIGIFIGIFAISLIAILLLT